MKKLDVMQMESLQARGYKIDCSDAGMWKIIGAGTAVSLFTGGWGLVGTYAVGCAWIAKCRP